MSLRRQWQSEFPPITPSFPLLPSRPRADTISFQMTAGPSCISSNSFSAPSHLPFHFGAEFEMILRPRANVLQNIQIPDFNASTRQQRDFNFLMLRLIASVLSSSGLPCDVYDQNADGRPDYSKWNATMDGSLSKAHCGDGYCRFGDLRHHESRHYYANRTIDPVEVVTPIIPADLYWTQVIDHFFVTLDKHFEFRRDTSCGFHVHISPATASYTLAQLRQMAKAVVFWEPATARCAPPSRQDCILGMCKSNVKLPVPVAFDLQQYGPWRGLQNAFDHIDNAATRDEIVHYVCTDKYRAWNFNPCKEGGFGSIEFRRAPGVVDAKKSKHWIAFTMSFVEMAIQFDPADFAHDVQSAAVLHSVSHPDFEAQLLACARQLNVYAQLDPRLRQTDNPRTLHITSMSAAAVLWLQKHDPDYGWLGKH